MISVKAGLEAGNPLQIKNWNDKISDSSRASIFHTQNWAAVLAETFGYEPLYFFTEDRGQMQALFPLMEVNSRLTGKRGVSLPFTDMCDPLLPASVMPMEILSAVLQLGKKRNWATFEMKGGFAGRAALTPSAEFHTHHLNLERQSDEIFAGFKSNARRNIRKARRCGVTVKICQSLDALKAYARLNAITKKRHGIPAQPFSFFNQIHRHIISQNYGNIALAYYKEEPIAGAIFFHFGNKVVFNLGASDKRFQNLRPNNLMMWEAARHYALNGFTSLSFGITDLHNEGLRRFKSGISTSEKTICYHKFNFQSNHFIQDNASATLSRRKILKKMPIGLLKVSGAVLYKHYG